MEIPATESVLVELSHLHNERTVEIINAKNILNALEGIDIESASQEYYLGIVMMIESLSANVDVRNSLPRSSFPDIEPEDGTTSRMNKVIEDSLSNPKIELILLVNERQVYPFPLMNRGEPHQIELLHPFLTTGHTKFLNRNDIITAKFKNAGHGLLKPSSRVIIKGDLSITISGMEKKTSPDSGGDALNVQMPTFVKTVPRPYSVTLKRDEITEVIPPLKEPSPRRTIVKNKGPGMAKLFSGSPPKKRTDPTPRELFPGELCTDDRDGGGGIWGLAGELLDAILNVEIQYPHNYIEDSDMVTELIVDLKLGVGDLYNENFSSDEDADNFLPKKYRDGGFRLFRLSSFQPRKE